VINQQDNAIPVVLLIDDDMVSRAITSMPLYMCGYTVHVSADSAASFHCCPAPALMASRRSLSMRHLSSAIECRRS
jgi:hypothetical protein